LNSIRTVDLLPYHRTAEGKYERMGLDNQLAYVNPPSVADVDSVHQKLTDHGLEVLIGGSS
jgi:ABC-type lipopolysaccharide export system ATPase subunit